MLDVHHFTYGAVTPLISYAAAVSGSACGLSAASRSRVDAPWHVRSAWLWLGAAAIGGTGIWVMHFVAMLGFTVTSMPIHYDVPLTVASAVVAVVVVSVGLHLVMMFGYRPLLLVSGGAVAGLGVAGMHYTGMWGVSVTGQPGAPDDGVPMLDLLGALLVGGGGSVVLLVFVVVGSRTESERMRHAALQDRQSQESVAVGR
ncbi:MHYT domain-containing protein [Cellulosimicrobium cellulans]|uniref:MHYT domain-containing protein n=1 Tax=Cellulosimicrobium cellulans TaxID=1710 RepID=UPI003015BA94